MSVEWQADALDRLADIYVAVTPTQRDAIVRCVEQMNARLALDPMHMGESRGPNRRVWFHHPLMVVYDLVRGGGVLVIHIVLLKGTPTDE